MPVDFAVSNVADLMKRAPALRQDYISAKPWPHIALEGCFPDELMDEVASECANVDASNLIASNDYRQIKEEASDGLGPATQRFLAIVDSLPFRNFISQVTGVDHLLPDPTHKFAGLHRTPPGGLTKIHRDFLLHPTTGLFHRVNLLVYLNRDWPDSYGGSLELWPTDMSALGRRIFPRFNTMVLWETHADTLHGLPDPVACPPDRMRLSVASYYYTAEPRAEPGVGPARGYWAARPGEDPSIERLGVMDQLRLALPEPIKALMRSARGKLRGR